MKTLLILFLFVISLFAYDSKIEDIMNEKLYRENITKLLKVKIKTNTRDCNNLKCKILNEKNIDDLIVSSFLNKWYLLKNNEWINPIDVEEIKLYSQQDFLIKKELNSNNKYVLYKGPIISEQSQIIILDKEYLIELNENLINSNKFKNYKLKEEPIVEYKFNDLLKSDLTNFELFHKDYDYLSKKEKKDNLVNKIFN